MQFARVWRMPRRNPLRWRHLSRCRGLPEFDQCLQRRHHAADRLGVLRMRANDRLHIEVLARLKSLDQVVQELLQRRGGLLVSGL